MNVSEKYMDKAVKMGKDSATGSFQLFIGRIVSTLMLAIGTIIVGIFIDNVEYGLYAIAVIPATTFLLFQDWGVASALTKYCANYRAAKREGELRNIIVSGLTFEAVTAIALTLLSLITANFVASAVFGSPESAFLIAFASITILSTAIYSVSASVFVGFERMELSTIAMIISAAVNGALAPLLVYLGFGAFGALVGFTVASVISGVTGAALLYFGIFRKLPLESMNKPKILQTLKPLLNYGIPLSIATIITGGLNQVSQFVMASSTDLAMIGNFKIATNFAIFLTFFTLPMSTVLFPAFSKLDPSKDKQLLKTVYASSVKYSSLFLVPAVMALMVLSAPMISTLYADKWLYAPFFLTLYVAGYMLVLLGNLSWSSLLTATGETKMLMKLSALSLCIGVPIAFLLIPPLGILGVIIVGYVAVVPNVILGTYWTWKRYETKPDLQNSARILLASTIAGVTTYLFLNAFVAAAWITLAIAAVLFLVVYLISVPLVGAVNQMDISNLRVMFSGLGVISKVIEIPLTLVEKLLRINAKRPKDSQ
jgi:O-antigen/teichoic acid export membrane protein